MLPALQQLERATDALGAESAIPLIAAPYLGVRTREMLDERGISYADTTGNVRLVASKPAIFVTMTGANKDPWPDDQPLRTLRGRGSARAVRALVDFRPPYGVRELASRAEVSPATLSRTIDLLAREALLTRNEAGAVADVDWAGAIRRWSDDYELRRSNAVANYLEPRGLRALEGKLERAKWRYATTGPIAAQQFAPVAPARVAAIYVDDISEAADRLDLKPGDTGANVLLVEPFDDVMFERTTTGRLVTVAPSQLAADLLTGPGRDLSEGEELLAWMKANEDAWRT